MKMRHVRAVAVAAVVVVALTGARRSGGGGCDDSSSSSSSSSSSGGYSTGGSSDYDDDDYQSSTGDYGSTPSAGPTTAAESDIRITDCVINGVSSTEAKITWKYTITNGDASGTADYSGTLDFKDSATGRSALAIISHDDIAAGQSYDGTEEDTIYGADAASLQGRCEVSSITKIPSL
ncbi:hypothetical protein [Streptomyces sp. Da 82-17]|uniref:hypothetical protein n=1 Tax=Streptomyces sp. Da 82-17 TaxID=3377116 RepID=UPI0038D46301